MEKNNKIVEKMKQLKFVSWDRTIRTKLEINVFGWIDRKDGNKDFIALSYFNDTDSFWFMTSSAKHSETIHNVVYGDKANFIRHYDCERVECLFKDVVNCVKLKNNLNVKEKS